MEISKERMKMIKSTAILLMVMLHLFNRLDYQGIFSPLVFIGKYPLVYYLSFYGDSCVEVSSFASAYGLMYIYQKNKDGYSNILRLIKLYLNYWLVFICFVLVFHFVLSFEGLELGSFRTIILSLTGLVPHYSGAWWFFTMYIILVINSKNVFRLVDKYNPIVLIGLTLILYIIGYYFWIIKPAIFTSQLMNYMQLQGSLFLTLQMPFVIGAILSSKRYKWIVMIQNKKNRFKTFLGLSIILSSIVFHSIVKTTFVGPFLGLLMVFSITIMSIPKVVSKTLIYISNHTTNIWLTHMLIYSTYFNKFIYSFKYPILIYLALIIVCLLLSTVLNFVLKYPYKKIDYLKSSTRNKKSSKIAIM